MRLENPKELIQDYLPVAEEFLTSVLLEEAQIGLVSLQVYPAADVFKEMRETDIFLFTRDTEGRIDLVLVLDQQWYGLLSSIMLGVEEKSNNEITRDLLGKFSSELIATIRKQAPDESFPELEEVQILTRKQVEKLFGHREYFRMKMVVEGLADHRVRAELIVGDPETRIDLSEGGMASGESAGPHSDSASDPTDHYIGQIPEESLEGSDGAAAGGPAGSSAGEGAEASVAADTARVAVEAGMAEGSAGDVVDGGSSAVGRAAREEEKMEMRPGSEEPFSPVGAEEMQMNMEPVISGREVEFEEFSEVDNGPSVNGESRLDLLKDVEMDVSVELGRIQLPLGKVLELAKGSVLELEKLAGEPVDILVNGHRVAQGEVVVIDEHFGVRISNLITTRHRLIQIR